MIAMAYSYYGHPIMIFLSPDFSSGHIGWHGMAWRTRIA